MSQVVTLKTQSLNFKMYTAENINERDLLVLCSLFFIPQRFAATNNCLDAQDFQLIVEHIL